MNKQVRSMFEDSIVVARLEDQCAIMLLALQQVALDLRLARVKDGNRAYYSAAKLDDTKANVERIIDEMNGHKPEYVLGALSARLSKIMNIDGAL